MEPGLDPADAAEAAAGCEEGRAASAAARDLGVAELEGGARGEGPREGG